MALKKRSRKEKKPKRRTTTLNTNQVLFTMWMDKDERNALREFAKDKGVSMASIGRMGIMSTISKEMGPETDPEISQSQ